MLFVSTLQFTASILGTKLQIAPPMVNICVWKSKMFMLTPKSGIAHPERFRAFFKKTAFLKKNMEQSQKERGEK